MANATWGARERPLQINHFPKGSASWHIDWFGPAAFPDRSQLYTRPSISVQLSRMDDGVKNPDVPHQPKQIKHVYVSVGTLMILGLGDIWSDRRLVSRNQNERVKFDKVGISPETTRVVKAGISLPSGGYLLPFGEHPWHMSHTHSYCVEVTMANGQQLIIPCPVLLKFYYGSSSHLLARLFQPGLKRPDLGSPWRIRPDQTLILDLASNMPGVSAEDVARILMNPNAWSAANMIGRSCLRASSRGEPAYPEATFPFLGATSLEVQGVWIHRGKKKPQAFVVHEIHSCSAPFPFNSLRYRMRTRPGDPKATSESEQRRSSVHGLPEAKAILKSPNKPSAPQLSERDASHNLAPSTAFIKERRRFPDLEHKRISHFRSHAMSPPLFRKAPGANNAFSLAGQGSAAPVRGLRLLEARRVSYNTPPPEEVIPYIRELAQHAQLTCDVVTVDEVDGWSVPMPPPKPGMKKIARACVFAVDARHQFATIVIPIVAPTSPLFYADVKLESEDDLLALLAGTPKDLRQQLRAPFAPHPDSSSHIDADLPQGVQRLRRALQLFFR